MTPVEITNNIFLTIFLDLFSIVENNLSKIIILLTILFGIFFIFKMFRELLNSKSDTYSNWASEKIQYDNLVRENEILIGHIEAIDNQMNIGKSPEEQAINNYRK